MSFTSQIPTNTSPYYYLPSGWDTAWKAAKSKASSQRVSVVGIGDSILEGKNCTDIMVNSPWATLRANILAANGNVVGGDCYSLEYATAFNSGGLYPSATPPLVVNGVNGTDYGVNYCAFNRGAFGGNTALTPFVSCTPPYNVTGFDILYMDYATGSWNYQVDSGSTTTVNTTGPGTAAGAIVKKISISGLTSASHTLKINTTAGGGANSCNILGITGYNGTTGLCFANMAWDGMGLVTGTSANNALSDTGKFPPDRLALYQGYQGTTVAPTSLSGLGFPAQPDLAIIAYGVNDAVNSVSKTTFRDALDRLVWSCRYGKADACSIIILAQYTADGQAAAATAVANSDYTAGTTGAYRDIKAAMIEVAQAHACAFVDVHGAFGRKPFTNGWISLSTDVHPSAAGYLKIANLLTAIV